MVIAKSKLFNVEEKKSFPAELKKQNKFNPNPGG
jgi:hypothetical protein